MHFTVYALNTWSGLFMHKLLHQHGMDAFSLWFPEQHFHPFSPLPN